MSTSGDGVFTRKDRKGYWISWTDQQGRRRYRKTNAPTLAQARKLRASELVRVEQSKALGFAPPSEDSFKDVGRRFLAHQKARLTERAYERERGIVEDRLSRFFACRVASIRKVDVQRYITERSGEVSAHTVQKESNILKHLLRVAVEWEIIPSSPATGVKSPRVPAGRVRYLQPSEVRALLEGCPEWLKPIVALAVSTGMRRSEILSLRWLDVDMHQRRILIPQAKNGEGRIVYANALAFDVLEHLQANRHSPSTAKLFSEITPNQVSVAFARVCRKLQIDDFRFHDLRHTAASWLRMKGADIHTVAQLLGHKDLRMAARYQHLAPAFLAEAVSRLDSVFGTCCYPGVTDQMVAAALVATTPSF